MFYFLFFFYSFLYSATNWLYWWIFLSTTLWINAHLTRRKCLSTKQLRSMTYVLPYSHSDFLIEINISLIQAALRHIHSTELGMEQWYRTKQVSKNPSWKICEDDWLVIGSLRSMTSVKDRSKSFQIRFYCHYYHYFFLSFSHYEMLDPRDDSTPFILFPDKCRIWSKVLPISAEIDVTVT